MRRNVVAREPMRWVLPVLFVLGGVLWAAAAMERWWPACRPGELGSLACSLIQDHRYDYVVPSAPWEPVGRAATYAGAGFLVLAAAFGAMGGRRPLGIAHLLAVVLALATAVVGGVTLASGVLGRPVAPSVGSVAQGVWALAGPPMVLGLCAIRLRQRRGADPVWFMAAFLVLATPIPGLLFTPTFFSSYDTASWAGAFGAVALVLAGGAALMSAVQTGVRSASGQGDGEDRVAGGGGQLDVAAVRLGHRVDDRQTESG